MSTTISITSTRSLSSTEYCKQGVALCINGKYHMDALRLFRLAIKKNPRNPRAYQLLGFSLVSLKRFGAALAAFRKCLNLAPHRMYYNYYLGKTHYLMGKYHLAIDEYRKALNSIWPLGGRKVTNAGIYREIGFTYLAWNKPREALWCYEKSISIGDYFGAPLQRRAMALKIKRIQPKAPGWVLKE